jgi:hypothetical protein
MRNASTILRWIAVLPAAILASWVTYYVLGMASMVIAGLIGDEASFYLRLVLVYAPKNAAFVLGGSAVSPRSVHTAIVLAIVAVALSLVIHILGQQRVGAVNYLHFTLESIGALLGVVVAYVITLLRKPATQIA